MGEATSSAAPTLVFYLNKTMTTPPKEITPDHLFEHNACWMRVVGSDGVTWHNRACGCSEDIEPGMEYRHDNVPHHQPTCPWYEADEAQRKT